MPILSFVKGSLGELQGRAASKFFLDEKVYRSLHNVTIPAHSGRTRLHEVRSGVGGAGGEDGGQRRQAVPRLLDVSELSIHAAAK